MVTAPLGLTALAFAVASGIAIYRTGETQPVFRALVAFGILAITPVVIFALIAMTMTGPLPLLAVVVPIILLGLGLYIVAEEALPYPFQSHEQAR